MINPLREAQRLEQQAAHETSLEKAQALALEADRLRRAANANRFFTFYSALPLLRS
jgi:hypothetical protein